MDARAGAASDLLALARRCLTGTPAPDISPAAGRHEVAIVSAYAAGRLVATGLGRGPSAEAATQQAALRASTDPRLAALADRSAARVELWLRVGPTIDIASLRLGIDSIGTTGRLYRPSVPLMRGLVGAERSVRELAGDDVRAAHRWSHFVESAGASGHAVELVRLRPAAPPVTAAVVDAAVSLACRRLLNVQAATGEYRYTDHAFTRVTSEPTNIVRMAGTTYAVAMASQLAAAPDLQRQTGRSAERGLSFLLGHAVAFGGGCLIRQPGDAAGRAPARAGAAALTLLAMQYGGLATAFETQRRDLVHGLLALQDHDGRFRGSSRETVTDVASSSQDYFPGETMLALVHEAERGDGRCFAAVTAGFAPYVEHFRSRPSLAFALWQTDVWWRVWRLVGGESGQPKAEPYAAFVRGIADYVIRRQVRSKTRGPGYAGGFAAAGKEPGISSACYVEAIAKAYAVTSDPQQRRRYRDSVRAGLRYVAALQVDPVITDLLPRPAESVGAFTRTLSDFSLRNDNDQHAITMLLDATRHRGLLTSTG
jgi:hypothetical protein